MHLGIEKHARNSIGKKKKSQRIVFRRRGQGPADACACGGGRGRGTVAVAAGGGNSRQESGSRRIRINRFQDLRLYLLHNVGEAHPCARDGVGSRGLSVKLVALRSAHGLFWMLEDCCP